jgi:hypothetical protein
MESMEDECDRNIEELIANGTDPSEMACKGVQSMITGAVERFALNFGMQCACDPDLTYKYGERLFIRAMDELKARRR